MNLMVIVIFTKYITVSKIFIVEMCMTLILTFRIGQRKKSIESPYIIPYLMATVIVVLSFTIFEIFAFEIRITLALTIQIGGGQM